MRKTFRYRLLGNQLVFDKADKWLDLCRHLYNAALEQRITAYRSNGVSVSCYEQVNELPELKVDLPGYQDVNSQSLQDVLERLDRAYKAFFRRLNDNGDAGFPRFRGKDRYDSFTLKQSGWNLDGRYLTIKKIGRFKLKLSRPIEGNIKTITIHKSKTGKWYACFSCDNVPEKKLPETGKAIGIDLGITSFLVDSDGNKANNPQHLKKSLKVLRRKQRKVSRRTKGSHRRRKARLQVAKAHEKVTNQRKDFLHKLANHYVQSYDTICVEDLNINGMVQNHKLARSINDCGWGMFIGLMTYKAAEAGRELVQVSRFEPSSKRCGECGAINQELRLSDRQWVCNSCGVLHDRDHNAARNILRAGQALQEVTYAGGQSVS